MIREQYLGHLWELLAPVPEKLRREWMYDYEEHFRVAAELGRSEEEAASELGDPRLIAKELLLNYRVDQAGIKSGSITLVSRAVFAAVSLGFFNLIFVLGPFVAILGVLIALWASAVAVALSSLMVMYEGLFGSAVTGVQASFIALALIGLGMLMGAGVHWLTRAFAKLTLQYLKFNTKVIRVKKG
ncbi:HAAS signaling domain-containing protein [Paenibacillus sacheonensis]|uniref:DUF1700 domain-containing protein n=1 Tax=Paenibacillus sacheonensis TaxID=742054 RepID=A0A7X5BZG0_9BACL|nr:DUF1700 domain-containing protein [Paenibacillus sacheonensis]MBM7568979.1 putative membrane protein [Paenibacillus sacheonensis]NBC72648.1 DUF1700 domain-containing protein [Paenibacillus sacheonensis]